MGFDSRKQISILESQFVAVILINDEEQEEDDGFTLLLLNLFSIDVGLYTYSVCMQFIDPHVLGSITT